MINKAFLTPRNLVVIGLISIVAHALARPLYAAIDNKG